MGTMFAATKEALESVERSVIGLTPPSPVPGFPDILRVTRESNGVTFAVFYFETSGELASEDEIKDLQEALLGQEYFTAERRLQWNYYLYFVTEKAGSDPTLEFAIESERNFARKRVLRPDELPALFQPVKMDREVDDGRPIRETWFDLLDAKGLASTIFSSEPVAKKVRRIGTGGDSLLGGSVAARSALGVESPGTGFLDHFELESYRDFPLQRRYTFGALNLLLGSNGSGKTSLLEAIEFFYSGKNRRSDEIPRKTSVFGWVGGKKVPMSTGRDNRMLRARNLEWYGQSDSRGSTLVHSFSRFNFLDTDAAFRLESEAQKTDLAEALALMLGAGNSSEAWNDLNKVRTQLGDAIRDNKRDIAEQDRTIKRLSPSVEYAKTLPDRTTAIRNAFEKAIVGSPWASVSTWTIKKLSDFTADLAQIDSLAKVDAPGFQTSGGRYAEMPISIVGDSLESDLASLGTMNLEILKCEDLIRDLESDAAKWKASVSLLAELSALPLSAIAEVEKEIAKLRRDVESASRKIQDRPPAPDLDTVGVGTSKRLGELLDSTAAQVQMTMRVEAESSTRLDEVRMRVDRVASLIAELHETAKGLLETTHDLANCPLCSTSFEPADLRKRIESPDEIGAPEVAWAQKELNEARENRRTAESVHRYLEWLAVVSDPKKTVDHAVSLSATLDSDCRRSQESLAKAEHSLRLLTDPSDPRVRAEEIREELGKPGPGASDVESELTAARSECERVGLRLVEVRAEREAAVKRAKEALPAKRFANDAVSRRVEILELASAQIREIVQLLAKTGEIPETLSLARIRHTLPALQRESKLLLQALREEEVATSKLKDDEGILRAAKSTAETKAAQNGRLESALKLIDGVMRDHPLEGSTDEIGARYAGDINRIFQQIHTPREFERVGEDLLTLRRGDHEVGLAQISTGQRSAYALSLFLAQNASLKHGPRVILLDDPIAHVDDLNCLAFLDYLREIVISGERQVFFATANEQLASLVRRKFDFLGTDEFRDFRLTRAEEPDSIDVAA